MHRILIQSVLLLAPFALWVVLVSLVDPYNAVPGSPLEIPNSVKAATMQRSVATMGRDWTLYKLEDFAASPRSCALFGDSRAFTFGQEALNQAVGADVFNFAVPGADIHTMSDLFWFAAARTKLSRVYLQIGFHNWGDKYGRMLAKGPLAVAENWRLYYVDHHVAQATVACAVRYLREGAATATPRPSGRASDAKWATWMRDAERSFRRGYDESRAVREVKAIIDYCRTNSIEVTLINMPMHPDVHRLIATVGLEQQHLQYKAELSSLGTLYDFDDPRSFMVTDAEFIDPIHVVVDCSNRIVAEAFKPRAAVNSQVGISGHDVYQGLSWTRQVSE
jgi:hypothetical protein